MMTPIRQMKSLSAALVVVALFAAGACAQTNPPSADVLEALSKEPPLPDIVEGRGDAPETIIEYASMTCSHCAAFHKEVWPALKAKYVDTGKAKFVLREFPLDPLAIAAFMLARCAGPDKRDAVVDRLFDHQADWAFAADPLSSSRSSSSPPACRRPNSTPASRTRSCRSGRRAMHDFAAATLGVESTPTFFVAGVAPRWRAHARRISTGSSRRRRNEPFRTGFRRSGLIAAARYGR